MLDVVVVGSVVVFSYVVGLIFNVDYLLFIFDCVMFIFFFKVVVLILVMFLFIFNFLGIVLVFVNLLGNVSCSIEKCIVC